MLKVLKLILLALDWQSPDVFVLAIAFPELFHATYIIDQYNDNLIMLKLYCNNYYSNNITVSTLTH